MGSRVLVVDDHPPMVRLMEDALAKEGYSVDSAGNGAECLDKLRADPPDLLILDLMMPVLNGMEALRRLRQDAQAKKVPVIILSARKDPHDMVDGWMSGADLYLTKPCNMEDLVKAVKHLVPAPEGGSARTSS